MLTVLLKVFEAVIIFFIAVNKCYSDRK